ncbi:MAG: 3-isopropylmalate dehydratase small subunit [Patescibacteria group bacterium]|nr:3-isopropylmalate dehydratase small subunit [Patescibacteria group bacterium]MDD5554731.1 3-isopropylmalate dehydratase small subunit [Patescibacteria group bacterium]
MKLSNRAGGGKGKDFSGKVFYFPVPNIDTDQIIPAKYLTETAKSSFGKHCMEDAPIPPEDRPKLFSSRIIVAGENFGCGSSREHAPWALEAAGIRCVIASSFARIFENNMFANGLLCIILPPETIELLFLELPEEISVDWEEGVVRWGNDRSAVFEVSDFQKSLIRNGGSVGVMLKLAARLQMEEAGII